MKPFTVQVYYKVDPAFYPNKGESSRRFQFNSEVKARRFAKEESMWGSTESTSVMFMGNVLRTYEQGDLVFFQGPSEAQTKRGDLIWNA